MKFCTDCKEYVPEEHVCYTRKKKDKMKKKTIIIIAAFILGAVVYSTASLFTTKYVHLKRPKISNLIPEGYDSASVADLYSMGFSKAKNIEAYELHSKRKMYFEKYGLMYMTDAEVKKILSDNNFIMGAADKYIGTIPKFAIDSIVSKTNQIHDKRSIYRLTLTHRRISYDFYSDELHRVPVSGWATWEQSFHGEFRYFIKQSALDKRGIQPDFFWNLSLQKRNNDRIMIIAGANQFDISGMQVIEGILSLPVPKDPIALLEVPGGYVELVNWE